MSDELTVRLHELAETAESPPPGSGAEVRATAGRRRRRRRTTAAVAGGCAAAGLAAVLTLNAVSHGTEQGPATAASVQPSATADAPDATVDLSRRVLAVAGRELPISAGTLETPTPTGRMTVTAKADAKVVRDATVGFDDEYDVKLTWVLELAPVTTGATATTAPAGAAGAAGEPDRTEATDGTDPTGTPDPTDPAGPADGTGEDGRTSEAPTRIPGSTAVWIAALSYNEKAPGNYDTTSGWIGLRTTDARWLYDRLAKGATVEIRGTTPTPPSMAPTPSPAPTPPG
ncbi:L,D-transpeptidase [Streptomyces sp. DSM 3412]|uniref:L,D-transpeptidase n=1 Tax=Streptomyces gottesmaniae TaxID=3075518 RepID=A0ABU2ZAE0_9ACTN|nr:L,D-transpeptidase [Streptomyces sp. DSM 3412]MDT0573567.1 L,D-transpeptidase [Streptomyces sp. DSM 3412]